MTPITLDSREFDPSKAASSLNRAKKLEGSYGLTTVIPMPVTSALAVNRFLANLARRQNLYIVQPNLTTNGAVVDNRFIDNGYVDRTHESRVIAPIERLHTTIAAWQVMDAVSQHQWKNELIRSKLCAELTRNGYDVFADGFYRRLVYDTNTNKSTKKYISELKAYIAHSDESIDKRGMLILVRRAKLFHAKPYQPNIEPSHIATFELLAASMKLNNDGNILIQWRSSQELKQFRQELSKHGGLAKWGEMVGTTIAYFPNWDKLSRYERQSIRHDIENMLENPKIYSEIGMVHLERMQVEPEQLRQVAFSRNNLAPNAADWDSSLAVFKEDSILNLECLSIQTYEGIKEELARLESPVPVLDARPLDLSGEFSHFKNKFKESLDELNTQESKFNLKQG